MTDSESQLTPQKNVLVVDDSRVIRKAVTTILSEQYNIAEARNGEEALLTLQTNQNFQAMLLDLWMPDVDGFEVLETLRSSTISKLNEMPIIIVTGHEDDVEMRERAEALGATDFIGKPFSAVELREAVGKHIQPMDEQNNVVPFKSTAQSSPETKEATTTTTTTPVTSAQEIRTARLAHLQRDGTRLLAEAITQRKSLALLRLRIDKVKALLHRTGTEFTKRTLYRVSKTIEAEIRRKDLLVRVGAAEFVIIMPNSSPSEAKSVARAIFRILRYTAFEYEEFRFRLTASAGLVTPALKPSLEFEQIMDVAEARTKAAVNAGGNKLFSDEDKRDATLLGLDEANQKLRAGSTQEIAEQLPQLLEQSLPLLVYANSSLELGINDTLKSLIKQTTVSKGIAN